MHAYTLHEKQEELVARRRNLADLEIQKAKAGAMVPTATLRQIEDEQAAIACLETEIVLLQNAISAMKENAMSTSPNVSVIPNPTKLLEKIQETQTVLYISVTRLEEQQKRVEQQVNNEIRHIAESSLETKDELRRGMRTLWIMNASIFGAILLHSALIWLLFVQGA